MMNQFLAHVERRRRERKRQTDTQTDRQADRELLRPYPRLKHFTQVSMNWR